MKSPSKDWEWSQDEDNGKGGWIYQQSELNSMMIMFVNSGTECEYAIIFHRPNYKRFDYSFVGELNEAMNEAETMYWHHINND